MKNKYIINNQSGFAIIETIAALAILAVALGGLMTTIQYGKAKAEVNYHQRYVLLRVDGELQRIKYRNATTGNLSTFMPVSFNIPNINRSGSREIPVTVTFSRRTEWDMTIGMDTQYHIVTATAEWTEPRALFTKANSRPERKVVQLREDYFFVREQ